MRHRIPWLCATFLIPFCVSAQDDRPAMSIVDMLNVPELSSPRLSPDGERLVYELAQADWTKNKQVTHLWLQETDGGEPFQLTFGSEGETNPRWSPDGRYVAFISKRGEDEDAQIFLLPTAGGEARPLTSHPSAVSSPTWAPDGSAVYFLAEEAKTDEEKQREELQDDVFKYDENKKHSHLWRQPLDAEEAERVTEGDFTIRSFSLSRDGSQIVVQRAPTPLLNSIFESEIHLLDADGSNWTQLTDNDDPETGAEISPNGNSVLYLSDVNEEGLPYHNANLFTIPADGGEPTLLMADVPWEIDAAHWSENGRSIYFIANTGVRTNLYSVEVDSGDIDQVTEGDHSILDWYYMPGSRTHVGAHVVRRQSWRCVAGAAWPGRAAHQDLRIARR